MSDRENWVCPVCGVHATLGDADVASGVLSLFTKTGLNDSEGIRLAARLVRCPNSQCRSNQFVVSANIGAPELNVSGRYVVSSVGPPAGVGRFQFLPTSANPLSAHVPSSVQEDYKEAHLIRHLSPKAAATLARRALQGMIRDFWGVTKRTLAEELDAIREQCDHALYEALRSVKAIGNIGAHPERDISLIVDIDPDEAQQLLDVIHLLDAEWYVARASREARIRRVSELGQAKSAARKPTEAG